MVLKTNEHPLGLLLLKQRSRLESVLESKQKLFALRLLIFNRNLKTVDCGDNALEEMVH